MEGGAAQVQGGAVGHGHLAVGGDILVHNQGAIRSDEAAVVGQRSGDIALARDGMGAVDELAAGDGGKIIRAAPAQDQAAAAAERDLGAVGKDKPKYRRPD